MSTEAKTLLDEKIHSLAQQYMREGFNVRIEPREEDLPFQLNHYRPDLIATKEDAGIIVEVKTSAARTQVERFQAIAEEVGKHPGWRFLLVTLDDVDSKSLPGTIDDIPSWQQFAERLEQSHSLINSGNFEPAFLYLWSIFEGMLRRRAIEAHIPVERFPVLRLINQMYTLGELSVAQYDFVRRAAETRNRVVHGYTVPNDMSFVTDLHVFVCGLLGEWLAEETEDGGNVSEINREERR